MPQNHEHDHTMRGCRCEDRPVARRFQNHTVGGLVAGAAQVPSLRLVNFLKDSMKQINHLEFWCSQAPTGRFP